jgi:MFS family permease
MIFPFFRIPPVLYHRRYFYLWLGLMVSIAGSQMQLWTLLWQVRSLTAAALALGGIGAARFIPVLVFSLIGGAVADVRNRRRIMFITQTTMALVALGLAWFTWQGSITIWHIYALTAVQAVAVAFDLPARQALVPNLVPAKDLPGAFSMNSIAMQTGSVVGPALAGLVIAYLGEAYAYFFNAVSFLAVILALIAMGRVEQAAPQGNGAVSLQSIAEGVRFILSQPVILSTMLLDFIATFFASANTLMPIVARDVLGVGAVEYGQLSAAQSIGAVVAAVTISQIGRIRRQGPVFLIAVALFGVATIAFGLATSFVTAFIALMVIGASDSVSTIIRNTIRQLQTPDHIRGRMTSVNQIFFLGGPQLGEVEAGLAAQWLGAPFAIISGGIGCLLGLGWVMRRWPALWRFHGAG